MVTRLKPQRVKSSNSPQVGQNLWYEDSNNFKWQDTWSSAWDMKYSDFQWQTLTWNAITIEDISNNITPSSNFTVSAGTVKPGIEYVLRVNTGNTAYTMTLWTGVTNPNWYNTELEPNTVNQFKFIATSTNQLELEGVDSAVISEINWGEIGWTLSNQTDLQTALDAKQDDMVILKYGISTWNDFITAYNKNAVVYCRASSNSNPATWSQTRLAFMAYVSNETTPTSVEFQYYRSRSDHNTQANQLDEVYVYKLESNWTWSVTQRNTAAKAVAWTWINLAFGSGNMTVSADTTVLATQTDLNSKQDTLVSWTNIKTINSNSLLGSWNLTLNDVKVSSTAPSSPTEWMIWYDTTNDILKTYDGSNWDETGWSGDIKIFPVPAVSDDISDIIAHLTSSMGVRLYESVSGTDVYYRVDYHDTTWAIYASSLSDSAARFYTINYDYLDNTVTSKTSSTGNFFTPWGTPSVWDVVTKTASGYEWAAPNGWAKVYDCDDLRSNWVQDLVTEFANGTLCVIQDNNATWASFWHFDQWTMWVVAYAGWWNIKAYNIAQDTNSIRCAKLFEAPYNTSTYVLWTITLTSLSFFAPWGTATTWYVVTKTAGGYEWAAPSGWDVEISSQANNILTSWTKLWAGTQANYEALGTYDNNTIYLTI